MSGPTSDSSSTYLSLGWTSPHLAIGTGYDFSGRQLREIALQPVPALTSEPGSSTDEYNVHSISTSEELKDRIKADLKATIPLEGASFKTENSYLSTVETSETSLTRIIQRTITDKPMKISIPDLKLTDTARSILEKPDGWKEFSQKYGEYFVYGYIPRASFSAIASIKTSNKETRDELKTSLEVEVKDSASFSAALESVKEKKTENVTIDIHVEYTSLKEGSTQSGGTSKVESGGSSTGVKTNNITEVQTLYDTFSRDYQTQPYLALLCHYSALEKTDKLIPLPINQFAHLGTEFENAYQNLYTAQIELSLSRMVQASETSTRIVELCDKIKTVDLNNQDKIQSVRDEIAACLNDVKMWRLRNDLITDVGKAKNENMNKGNWTDAGGQGSWSTGILGLEGDSKYGVLNGEVTHVFDHFRESSWIAHYNTHDAVRGDNDKIIIGFKISSFWGDNTNGQFKWDYGQVLESEVKVEFSSYLTRGCDWQLDVWMVSKSKYERKSA